MEFVLDMRVEETGCFFPCSICKNRNEDFAVCKVSCSLHCLSTLDAEEIASELQSIILNVNRKARKTA